MPSPQLERPTPLSSFLNALTPCGFGAAFPVTSPALQEEEGASQGLLAGSSRPPRSPPSWVSLSSLSPFFSGSCCSYVPFLVSSSLANSVVGNSSEWLLSLEAGACEDQPNTASFFSFSFFFQLPSYYCKNYRKIFGSSSSTIYVADSLSLC